MDYSKLRAAALKDGEDEEAVTVDTRALIDKVLARYSGEWTTLRELIQNAADAQATTVKIRWETLPSTQIPLPTTQNRSEILKHIIVNHTLRRLVVQNDGQPFAKTDWARLKRIAEGNPDETKIGAFGVGFYSVFADCEEPFVSSGSEAMAFYWKGNALFTRKLVLPAEESTSETAFVLDYRNTTTPVPNILSICQFLATSLTFVALQQIEFWIDDYQILSLHKIQAPSVGVSIPKDLETKTREGLMKLSSVDRASVQINATSMSAIGWKPAASTTSSAEGATVAEAPSLRSFFSRLTSTATQAGIRGKAAKEEAAVQQAISEDITALSKSSIFLQVTTGSIQTKVSASFSAELERATKKPPPKNTRIAILTSSYDETLASESSTNVGALSKAADVFASVSPSKKPGGRVFIGFPTAQTTGAGMHISAPSVIPTVEREAIDLNARWVRTWNIEMLRVAGIMTRLAFTSEMILLETKLKDWVGASGRARTAIPTKEDIIKFLPEALHILKTYTFQDSTPSANVGQIIEESFWTAFSKPIIEVYSSRGVLQTSKVRMGSDEMSKFVDGIPVILDDMVQSPFIKKLRDWGLIQDITVDDVRQEFNSKALNKDQLTHFISWAAKQALGGELDPSGKSRLFDVAVATLGEGQDSGEIITLSSVTTYLSSNKIPPGLPIPPSTIPFAFTNQLSAPQLQALGWQPLEIVPWLRFLIESSSSRSSDENITTSPKFSVSVLTVLSKNWDNLSQNSRASVIAALLNTTVMPTKMGMKKPNESFFPTVKLFDDLPTIEGCQSIKDKFLSALGVRRTLDMETIFSRLLMPAGDNTPKLWSHMELIKYLASVRDDIPRDDLKKLKTTPTCPAEAGPAGMESSQASSQLYKIPDLFEPKSELRELGLPLLQWPGPPGSFRVVSKEGRFLISLGLRPHPNVNELVDLMASPDVSRRDKARNYFIKYHSINNYSAYGLAGINARIMPLQGNSEKLVAPSDCYVNEHAAILGFNILAKDLHEHANKFGVSREPPIDMCVAKLIANPPKDRSAAITLFNYFATRVGDMKSNNLAKLKAAAFVPVSKRNQTKGSKDSNAVVLVLPQSVYLGSSKTYGEIFDFVDFGELAHTFLVRCGAKMEPTQHEIATFACNEPARLLSTVGSTEKYLDVLRSLATDLPTLKSDKELYHKMKTEKWLIAYKEIPSKEKASGDDDEDGDYVRAFQLEAPSKIVVADDFYSFRLFREHLLSAPEDDTLELFYHNLGAPSISSQVQEYKQVGRPTPNQEGAVWLRNHILERSKLYLHEYRNINSRDIKHDAKWLDKNLSVEVVQSVQLRRSLKGHNQPHTEKRAAIAMKTPTGYTLYVAADQGDKPDMYQVGQAVCTLILSRHHQQAYLVFEPFLKLNLLELRARGYNVDRILRAKAAEARMFEEEQRKALEAEEQRIKERQAQWTREQEQMAEAAARRPKSPETPKQQLPRLPGTMPGSFESDSPEAPATLPPTNQIDRRSKGFFSNITRRWGLDKDENEGHTEETPIPEQKQIGPPGPSNPPSGPKPQGPGDNGRVTSPAVVQNNLLQAIRSTRAHGSSSVFSPPRTQEIKEQSTYCDSAPAQNIIAVAQAPRGMKIYLDRTISIDHMTFLDHNRDAILRFELLLRDVADIYGVSYTSLQIHYDEHGPCIAFNTGGSIFCNLRFFLQLHYNRLKTAGAAEVEGRVAATVYWFVVVAHELAHNLVSEHDANHSFYSESFVQEYFHKMMTLADTWRQAADNSVAVTTNSQVRQPPPYSET
ncbi:hypothetical protein BD289DRAFT_479262 [Coniella lustricola]|uniref:Sacsin/Nov domain-containing protein n=1 Tax=Coniella lustricola TaxID=2025994 RepID=A0A2T3AJQ5_9PEZI|nr:hypothetical protein BD289DRAFT_479262 [Coniella lustricola]